MKIQFWGVRGSIPTPITSEQIQAKIAAALNMARPEDLRSAESKNAFISKLSHSLYHTVGGNTPCVEVISDDGTKFIFDAGTGIRLLGKKEHDSKNLSYNIFFSHFHWDHIQGLPFFDPIYKQNIRFNIYSPFENMKEYLQGQMISPYYPVNFETLQEKFDFHKISPDSNLNIGNVNITLKGMSHPGNSFSYALTDNGKKFVYATDVELSPDDFGKDGENSIFSNADILVLDAQYTAEEAARKKNWGHSAFCNAIEFAASWNVKKLYLFHHEPTYDDEKLDSILRDSKEHANSLKEKTVEVYLAEEGVCIEL